MSTVRLLLNKVSVKVEEDKMVLTRSLLNVLNFYSLNRREQHRQTHSQALYCSRYDSSGRVKLGTLKVLRWTLKWDITWALPSVHQSPSQQP